VPKRLHAIFQKREIKKRLNTNSLQVARLQASYIASHVLEVYKRLNQMNFNMNNNSICIADLNIQCENELTDFFSTLYRLAPDREIFLRSAANGLDNKITPEKKVRISAYYEELSQLMLASGRWDAQLIKANRAIIDSFIEVIGNKYLDEINFQDAELYFSIVCKLPKNRNKDRLYRDLTCDQIIKLKPTPMAPTSINKYMDRISQVLTHAVNSDYIQKNHFRNPLLRIKDTRNDKDLRQSFTDEDLSKIFKGDLYLLPTDKTRSYYWTYLLLQYTGSRLNEICQLHVKDIKQEDGVWFIEHIKCCDKKKIKGFEGIGTIARRTPLHDELIEHGFLEYVHDIERNAKLDKDGYLRLFPDFTYTEKARYGKKASEFFNGKNGDDGYKHRINLRSTEGEFKLDIHSFRHTVATALQQAGVAKDIGFAITGHKEKNQSVGDRYRKGYTLLQLQEAINKISFRHILIDNTFQNG
jgi:integrase